jgi:PhoH-like ATPase
MKSVYVLDTSVLLTDPDSIYSFKNSDVLISFKVLEELDKNKNRQDIVGTNARRTIKLLDDFRKKGPLNEGVRISKGKGLLFVKGYSKEYLPKDLKLEISDNEIIASALTESSITPDKKVIMVSRDINMRVKCDALGILCNTYEVSRTISKREELYTGFTTVLVDEQVIENFYKKEDVILNETIEIYPNEFVMLVSNSNDKKTALARFKNSKSPLVPLPKKLDLWGVKPRNKEQTFAIDLLMDPSISIVSLIGKPGSGKTLLSIAAGLMQTIGDGKNIYDRMLISRPIQPMGKDIGFLPGTMEEKMLPWLKPISDNLQYLLGDKSLLEEYTQKGIIEIEALTYIRGRTLANAFIIIDEAQNLTVHEIKTIITRVGENSKIVLTGDIEQIDNIFVNEITNGLTHALENFKEHDVSGHVTLIKGERSRLATLAANIL